MSPRLLLLMLLPLLGLACNDACEQRCDPLQDFYERCAAELDAAGVVLVCYDDQLTAFPDGSIDPAAARACTDGQDYAASCLSASHAQANALSGPDNADRVRACAKEEPWIRAVRSGDCQGAIDAWLDREPRGYAL